METPEEGPVAPELRRELLALGQAQLVAQVTASTGLDTQALGIMGFDVAVAAIVVSVRGGAYLWVLSLLLLAFSAAFAVQTLLYTPNPDVGPSVRETLGLRSSSTNEEVRGAILDAVAKATHENITVLAVKAKPVGGAMRYLFLAIVAGALGRV